MDEVVRTTSEPIVEYGSVLPVNAMKGWTDAIAVGLLVVVMVAVN